MFPKSRNDRLFRPAMIFLLAGMFVGALFAADGGGPFALVLIDTDALACSPCLEPLQALCRAVPPAVQGKRLRGVLTYRDGEKPDRRRARIALTRWTGYSRANGILFPASVDEVHAFNRLSEEGTTILLFDEAAGGIRRWTAPFSPDVLRELAEFLSEGKPDTMEHRP